MSLSLTLTTAMTTPEENAAPAAAAAVAETSTTTTSNPFLSADDVHDRATHLVLDTSPFLRGGAMKLRTLASKFYTIPEVLNEIRDKQARDDLALLPFDIQVINPTEASVRAGNRPTSPSHQSTLCALPPCTVFNTMNTPFSTSS
jgi:RNA-binding protein NOB1